MNKVILVGRLVADPELRQTQNGVASCRIRIAVDRKFADKSTGERQSDFINCTAWRQTAEFISRYFSKGKLIAVEGSLRTGSYTDKNHPDVTHYTTDVFVDNVEFVGGKSESGGNGGNQNYNNGGYNNGGYNAGNNGFQAPPAQSAPSQPAPQNNDMSYGDLSDFEEILSDGDVPF
ncbi:MAG TPA: single-stranded DNA-binding protein [Ruminococcus sp.]|nr:single-stranded DNA-binding protein [Ruminococcus sp.]